MEQQQQQHQLLEVKVEVAVQRPAWLRQQQVLRQFASSGAVTCSAVVSALQQEFGPGNLCDDDDVVYLPTVQLQPGNAYVYKVFRNRGQRQGAPAVLPQMPSSPALQDISVVTTQQQQQQPDQQQEQEQSKHGQLHRTRGCQFLVLTILMHAAIVVGSFVAMWYLVSQTAAIVVLVVLLAYSFCRVSMIVMSITNTKCPCWAP